MKRILIVISAYCFFACNAGNSNTEATTAADTTLPVPTDNRIDVSMIRFASINDPFCEMPVTAGISDTLSVDGKTYGFCSAECKNEYIKTVTAHK